MENAPSIRHEDCWAKTTENGKPGISVRDHCLNVGCVAKAIVSRLPQYLLDLLPPGVVTLAALHDVGKVSPGFQAKCPAWLKDHNLEERAAKEGWFNGCETDHAKVSQFSMQERMTPGNDNFWAAAVGAHHGNLKGTFISGIAEASPEHWRRERRRLITELEQRFGKLPQTAPNDAALFFTAGLVGVADWIGSNEVFFPLLTARQEEERVRKAQEAIAVLQLHPASFREGLPFTYLFPSINAPSELQSIAVEKITSPGLYVIEGPMGCGKTEAALAAAYNLIAMKQATGIYFALPTQTTSNRIHLRIAPFLKNACANTITLRLAHGASWLEEEKLMFVRPAYKSNEHDVEASQEREHSDAAREWFASAKRALLATVGVGTVDQSLLGIVAAKHFFVRQFALAGKVVILDEIHTYDLYTSTLIDTLVKRLQELKCTVIVLSATLTKKRRENLLGRSSASEAYPLLSGCVNSGKHIEVGADPGKPKKVLVAFKDETTLHEECLLRAARGECVLWIRNTVHEAQQTYLRLLSDREQGGPEIALLHARFPFFQRERLENDWMERLGKDARNRPRGCVFVSTQVAEQSVDIDADLLITDMAPTDMLLQRMGRLWRHNRGARPCATPEIWIRDLGINDCPDSINAESIKEAFGKSVRVYAPYVLVRSLDQWRNIRQVRLPQDIRRVLEATYADLIQEPNAWKELKTEMLKEMKKQKSSAEANMHVFYQPHLPDEEGVQTRYSKHDTANLVIVKERDSDGHMKLLDDSRIVIPEKWDFAAAKAIHRNLVRIPLWSVKEARKKAPSWLKEYVSTPCVLGILGETEPGRVGVPLLIDGNSDSELYYRDDLGIVISKIATSQSRQGMEEWEDESLD